MSQAAKNTFNQNLSSTYAKIKQWRQGEREIPAPMAYSLAETLRTRWSTPESGPYILFRLGYMPELAQFMMWIGRTIPVGKKRSRPFALEALILYCVLPLLQRDRSFQRLARTKLGYWSDFTAASEDAGERVGRCLVLLKHVEEVCNDKYHSGLRAFMQRKTAESKLLNFLAELQSAVFDVSAREDAMRVAWCMLQNWAINTAVEAGVDNAMDDRDLQNVLCSLSFREWNTYIGVCQDELLHALFERVKRGKDTNEGMLLPSGIGQPINSRMK